MQTRVTLSCAAATVVPPGDQAITRVQWQYARTFGKRGAETLEQPSPKYKKIPFTHGTAVNVKRISNIDVSGTARRHYCQAAFGLASVAQAPWDGSTFQPLNSDWGKRRSAFVTHQCGLTPDKDRDADWLSGQLWKKTGIRLQEMISYEKYSKLNLY